MVAVLIRLKVALLRRSLSASDGRAAGVVIGAIIAAMVVVSMGLVAIVLRSAALDRSNVLVLLGAAGTLGWLMLSVGAFGADATLDPARLSLLPVQARRLLPGLGLASLIGVPGMLTVALAIEQVIGWSRSVQAAVAALVAAVLGVSTCVLLARTATTALAEALSARRGRELIAVVMAVVMSGVVLSYNMLIASGDTSPSRVHISRSVVDVAGWTPFGWAWVIPWDVSRGAWITATVHLLLAAALVGGLLWSWQWLLDRALCSSTTRSVGKVRARTDRGTRTGPVGAIARRRLVAWRRDSRLLATFVRLLIAPVLFIVASVVEPHGAQAVVAPIFLAAFTGVALANDLAYDGVAWWMQLAAGVPGWCDRAGRALGLAGPLGLLTLVLTVVLAACGLLPDALVWFAPVVSTLACAIALGLLLGAFRPGQAPKHDAGAFANQAGDGAIGCVMVVVCVLGPVLLSLPVGVAAWFARDSVPGTVAVLIGSLCYGVAALAAGITLGGRALDRRAPEMLGMLARFG